MNRKRLTALLLVAGLSISQVMMVSATDQSQESVSPTTEQGQEGTNNTGTEDKKDPSNLGNDPLYRSDLYFHFLNRSSDHYLNWKDLSYLLYPYIEFMKAAFAAGYLPR